MESVITFTTVFLGLITGSQELAVKVAPPVELVEILVNEEVVATIDGEPWTTRYDFGVGYVPVRLVARAFDAEGQEIGSVEQWLNVARPPAEVDIVLSKLPGSDRLGAGALQADLAWRSLSGENPVVWSMFLDGEEVEMEVPSRVVLPPINSGGVHVLRVDLEFADQVFATKEIILGGTYSDTVRSELTAVPLLGGPELLTARLLEGKMTAQQKPVRVAVVEKGPIDVIVVREASAVEALRKIVQVQAASLRRNRSLSNVNLDGQLKRILPMDRRASLRFLWPYRVLQGPADVRLFPRSQELKNVHGGLFYLLGLMALPEVLQSVPAEQQQLLEAVAVAGMSATRRNRRRLVLFILGEAALPEPASSSLTIAVVRDYLAMVGVPLVVWTPDRDRAGRDEDWGEIVDISSMSRFRRAAKDLWADLDRQRIVWLYGRHLPQTIETSYPGTRIAR